MIYTNISCQPNETDIFRASNMRKCQRYVRSIQRKLDKAVANGDKTRIRWYFHLLSKRSIAAKILAVNRITRINQGKYTAGIDQMALPVGGKQTQENWRHQRLSEIDVTSTPSPIRRVYIPKPNGKRRPLGIATITDRIVQEIFRQALEPIAEYHFSNQSYGFRPKRCAHDAVEALFGKLSRKGSRRWIVEGDIKGCFDDINHDHILKTLQDWHTPEWAIDIIRKMIKTKILCEGEAFSSDKGTPQGSVISPMLANVALTTLDEFCTRFGWRAYDEGKPYIVNPIVRYADDFVVVCQSELKAKYIKKEVTQFLKQEMGLDLSEEKTLTTHISKGFNFLGFNFRKYKENSEEPKKKPSQLKPGKTHNQDKWKNYKLIITPQKEKVSQCLIDCKRELKTRKTIRQEVMVKRLNSKLMGWGNYYRFVCSKKTFNQVDHHIWWKVYRWAKRRHPNKSTSWVINKYFSRQGNWKHVFHDKQSNTSLFLMSRVSTANRWVKINSKYRAHESDKEAIEYWQRREYLNARDSIYGSETMTKLFKSQKGYCTYCNRLLTRGQIKNRELHKHHMKPRSLGGDNKLRNLRLIHSECHREIHALYTRKEMSDLVGKGIEYIRLMKPKPKTRNDIPSSHRYRW